MCSSHLILILTTVWWHVSKNIPDLQSYMAWGKTSGTDFGTTGGAPGSGTVNTWFLIWTMLRHWVSAEHQNTLKMWINGTFLVSLHYSLSQHNFPNYLISIRFFGNASQCFCSFATRWPARINHIDEPAGIQCLHYRRQGSAVTLSLL